jgi:hypothetical protein
VLRSHIDHCLETWICVHNLQRGTIRRRGWHSWKVHEPFEERVTAIVRTGKHVQTMGRQAVTVVFPDVIAIAGWWESGVAE